MGTFSYVTLCGSWQTKLGMYGALGPFIAERSCEESLKLDRDNGHVVVTKDEHGAIPLACMRSASPTLMFRS